MDQKTANTIAVLGVSIALVGAVVLVVSQETELRSGAYLVAQGASSSTSLYSSQSLSSQSFSSQSFSNPFSSLAPSSAFSSQSISLSRSSFSFSFSQTSFSSFSFSRSSEASSSESSSSSRGGTSGGTNGDGGDFGGLIGIGGDSGGGFIGGGGTFGGVTTGGGGGGSAVPSSGPADGTTCRSDEGTLTCIPLIQPLGPSNIIVVRPLVGTFIDYFNLAVPLLMTLAVGFCVLWILIGSYLVMISGSDGGKRSEGKSKIMWAVIGLILVNFAGFFLRTLNNIFFI